MHATVVMADIIAQWKMVRPLFFSSFHLCEVLADVIARWQMEYHQGGGLADVIAKWQME